MTPDTVRPCAEGALCRLDAYLFANAPFCRERLCAWFPQALSGRLDELWLKPTSFPLLQLPFWFAHATGRVVDEGILEAITRSSMSGYLYLRLVDQVMDRDGTADPRLLPIANVLHAAFQGPYQEIFPHSHPFWSTFHYLWGQASDITLRDGLLDCVGQAEFEKISSLKFTAARIPIAAIATLSGKSDDATPWYDLVDALGRWFQLHNDLFDCLLDAERGASTFVLTHAAEHRGVGQSLTAWLATDGIRHWGDVLRDELKATQCAARDLRSDPLLSYLQCRRDAFEARIKGASDAAAVLRRLLTISESVKLNQAAVAEQILQEEGAE